MNALKVIMEGLTASFRYPHFLQGVQPTFEMPPPATLYGLVCAMVGDNVARDLTRYAVHFSYQTKFYDYEHLHFFGREPKMNPFKREMLFMPKLTLYLDNVELEAYVRSPAYAISLGRSQDLMTITHLEQISVQEAETAFFDGTLLTLEDAAEVGGQTYAVTMPRFIDEARQAEWAQFSVLPHTPRPRIYPDSGEGIIFGGRSWSVDPSEPHPFIEGVYRAIVWHNWSN